MMARILIVDDSAYARRVHRAIFERAGHEVIEVSTGTAAIEACMLEQPDVVILDLSMEDIGGLQVLQTLREMNTTAQVIVVSADVQRSTEQSVMAAGAARFIGKPAQADVLLSVVAQTLAGVR
jgi:two-component system chemotaxis response regulator CheY